MKGVLKKTIAALAVMVMSFSVFAADIHKDSDPVFLFDKVSGTERTEYLEYFYSRLEKRSITANKAWMNRVHSSVSPWLTATTEIIVKDVEKLKQSIKVFNALKSSVEDSSKKLPLGLLSGESSYDFFENRQIAQVQFVMHIHNQLFKESKGKQGILELRNYQETNEDMVNVGKYVAGLQLEYKDLKDLKFNLYKDLLDGSRFYEASKKDLLRTYAYEKTIRIIGKRKASKLASSLGIELEQKYQYKASNGDFYVYSDGRIASYKKHIENLQ